MTALPAGLDRDLVLRWQRVSWTVRLRGLLVTLALIVVCAVLACVNLALGEYAIPLGQVVATLAGQGTPAQSFIVLQLRLPQTAVAVLVGAALGLSGALTQTFARNPLASPDILGVTRGAAVGAVAVIIASGATGIGGGLVTGSLQTVGVPVAAFVGGLATATVLYLLSWRRGIDGGRLILVGIGVGAFLSALTSWMLVSARIEDVQSAQVWLNGSLNARGWEHAGPVFWTLVVLVPVSLLLIRALNAMQLGDDAAIGLGVRLQVTQVILLICAVGLVSVSVSAVGPLEFVAFVVPQIALRLTGGSRPPMIASMVLGSCLVVAADLIARVVLPIGLPAGLITAAIGAPYLIYVLLRSRRKVSA